MAVPLRRRDGALLGTLCALDTRPTPLPDAVLATLEQLARLVAFEIEEDERRAAMDAAMAELRANQRALRESEERFRSLTLATTQIVWTADATGAIVHDSPSWMAFTGQSAEEHRGHGWLDAVHPEDRARVRETWREAIAGCKAYDMEYRLRRQDGSYPHIHARGVPVLDERGEVREWVGANTDVTTAKRTGNLLDGQKALLELVARDVPLGQVLVQLMRLVESQSSELRCSLLVLDGDRLRVAAAPSLPEAYNRAIDGVAIGPGVGSCGTAAYLRQAIISEDIASDPRWTSFRQNALAHGLRASWSTPVLSSRGEVLGTFTIYYERARPPSREDEQLVGVATHIARIAIERHRDSEALRQRAADLAEADRRKDEFLAMLSHELRNPLAPVLTSLGLMRRQLDEPEALARHLGVVERQMHHLRRLVDDLLDVSRITRGKIELQRERLDAREVIATAVETTRPVLEARAHTLELALGEQPLWVMADAVRLGQVLVNLLSNAAKYSEAGGRIAVSARVEGDELAVTVRDSGSGIAPEVLPHVFDLFVQGDQTLDRAQGGLGIGLTLVRRLVELHGGRVTARSDGPGRGSEFEVRLPLARGDAAPAHEVDVNASQDAASAQAAAAASATSRRVLVVDDNVDAAEVLAELLTLSGLEVHLAHDGPQALAEALRWRPDAVVLDIGLPGMDGFEVARRLREEFGPAAVPRMVALSGYASAGDKARGQQAGFASYLVKPVDIDRIEQALGL